MVPRYTNVVLILEIAMGVGLLGGAMLARLKHFRSHAWCQSAVLFINFFVIVLTMVPSFHAHVFPEIRMKLGRAYYALATAHSVFGAIAEIAGLYILLAAGTTLLAERIRITRYKVWMRTVLALWWTALLLGLATYAR